MYFYIYDSFLIQKKYSKFLDQFETRTSDLGISGRISRLTILKNATEIIKTFLNDKAPTIVVVGSDQLFYEAARAMAGSEAVLGFVPTSQSSEVASILGLPINEFCADVISARLIKRIKFGEINGRIFCSLVEFSGRKTVISCDKSYQVIPKKIKTVKIINFGLLRFDKTKKDDSFKRISADPKDDFLEVLMGSSTKSWWPFSQKEKGDSLFFAKEIKVEARKAETKIPIKVDQKYVVESPADIKISDKSLKIIVGKNRLI